MNTIRKKVILVVVWAVVVPVFVLSQISFWQNPAYAADSIADLQKQIDKVTAAKIKDEQNLIQIKSAVSSTQSVINKTQAAIQEVVTTISRKEAEINNLNDKIILQGEMLKNFLQQIYYIKSQPIIGVVLAQGNFTDILSNADHMMTLEDKIVDVSHELGSTKTQVEQDKIELAQAKQKHEQILDQKIDQKQELVADQIDVQQEIKEKEATIGELKQKMAELQKDLNKILGKSYDTGEIKDAIKFANKITGVRAGFLFGVMSMESGGNTDAGNCDYSDNGMNKTRKNIFENIVEKLAGQGLKYTLKNRPLSCASKSYPGSGGAMGVAQFMSDTWGDPYCKKTGYTCGYAPKIAAATGNSFPDPWDLLDGTVAMALKLKNDGATESGTVRITVPRAPDSKTYKLFPQCSSPSGTQKKASVKWEIYASMRYLGWTCYGYAAYAPGIQSLAKGYDNL